jgi:hypothetical protein
LKRAPTIVSWAMPLGKIRRPRRQPPKEQRCVDSSQEQSVIQSQLIDLDQYPSIETSL